MVAEVDNPMKVALYARCSTDERNIRQNPETQLVALRQYAAARGWEVVGEYVDRASATSLRKRTAWNEVRSHAARRHIDIIAVARLDRAFRSMIHFVTTLEELGASGVALVSLAEPWVNTADSSPLSDLIRNILVSVAQFERGLIGERTRAGMYRARLQGRHLGRISKLDGGLEALRPSIESGALSRRRAARQLGVNVSTVSRALRKGYRQEGQESQETRGVPAPN